MAVLRPNKTKLNQTETTGTTNLCGVEEYGCSEAKPNPYQNLPDQIQPNPTKLNQTESTKPLTCGGTWLF